MKITAIYATERKSISTTYTLVLPSSGIAYPKRMLDASKPP